MPDTFETKFSKVIQAQINDKLPSLIPYQVGFQLIDKTEDEDKAVGIAAFVINDVWIYLLAFFLEGKIKGLDILYVKDTDTIIPAKDNWIALFKEEAGRVFGFLKEKNKVDGKNINSVELSDDYIEKSSNNFIMTSDLQQMLSVNKEKQWLQSLSLPGQLEKMGSEANVCFAKTLLENPEFANKVFDYYSATDISKIASQLVEQKVKEVSPEGKVTFIESIEDVGVGKLDSREKKLLLRNGSYIKDKRTSFSKVFYDQPQSGVVKNPERSGVYEVLLSDGTYKPFVIYTVPGQVKKDHRSKGKDIGFEMGLVPLDSPKKFVLKRNLDVFVREPKNYDEIKKKLEKITLGVSPTVPAVLGAFSKRLQNSLDNKVLFVKGREQAYLGQVFQNSKAVPSTLLLEDISFKDRPGSGLSRWDDDPVSDTIQVDFTDTRGNIRKVGGKLYIPEDARVLINSDDTYAFGNPQTLYGQILKTASCGPLRIDKKGSKYLIVHNGDRDTLDKVAALKKLVIDKGIYAGQAQQILKRTDKNKSLKLILKESASIDELGSSYDSENAIKKTKETSGESSSLSKSQVSDIVRADKAGIKEVFDTSVIKAILSKIRVKELNDDYVSELVQAMDASGRLLLLFYWHRDFYEAKYGKGDLENLENSIKDLFLQTGDVVYFLREKSLSSGYLSGDIMGTLSGTLSTAEAKQ